MTSREAVLLDRNPALTGPCRPTTRTLLRLLHRRAALKTLALE